MGISYILVACGVVGLAITYNLWGRSQPSRKRNPVRVWVTRQLYRGDLRALSDAAHGRFDEVAIDQFNRLRGRGFVARGVRGNARVTMRGRLALMLRGPG